jgi:hypothetical protein
MNRRQFHRLAAAPLVFGVRAAAASQQRLRAPFRLLYSNDTTNIGGCVSRYHDAGEPFRKEMLEASVDETAGTGVDAHFLQPGLGVVPMWPSKVLPLEEHYRWLKDRYGQEPDSYGRFVMAGHDVVRIFLERCRQRGMAGFISLRMNDAHHKEHADTPPGQKPKGNLAMSVTRAYAEHPEWRIKQGSMRGADVVLNWAVPEVREMKRALIEELCTNYDLDGLELDFMRFYSLFREEETPLLQRRAIITAFVREVREIMNLTARGNKRVWLCLRVPALLKGLDALGLDLAGLHAVGVDMFNVSSSYYTVQQSDFASIRSLAPEAAFYLELCHTTWTGPKLREGYDVTPFRRTTREQYQTAAHLAYARGAAGVSVFNFAYYRKHGAPERGPFHEPPFDVLPTLRDAQFLARQPQHWILALGWNNPYVRPPRLPRALVPNRRTGFVMDLAPPRGGWQGEGRLRFQFAEPPGPGECRVFLNGEPLQPAADVSEPYASPYPHMLGTPDKLRAWRVPNKLLRDGKNELDVMLLSGEKAMLDYIDLAIR